MLRRGLFFVKVSEYFKAADVDADLEFVELGNNQIAFLMTADQKQFFALGYFDCAVFIF